MSDKINDGGPAFPVSTGDPRKEYQDGPYTAQFPGLSLRDYFAAKAMQAAMTRGPLPDSTQAMDGLARDSYHMADAMLRARDSK